MQQFRKILIGVDLSHGDRFADSELNPPTLAAIKRAVWLAGRTGAELMFFAALDLSADTEELVYKHNESAVRDVEDIANEILENLVAEARQQGVASADSRLVIGQPWRKILRAVVRDNHDLVVIGAHSRGAASRLLFGSVALRLLRNCPVPVWVTRPDPDISDLNMLVATDLGETSADVLQLAVSGGQLANTKIHVVHAIDRPGGGWFLRRSLPPDEVDAVCARRREEAEKLLQEQLAQTDWRTVSPGVQVHVVDGPPQTAILKAIDELGIDLLVMSTSSKTGLAGTLMGSTAEHLLAHVSCSVLAIKPRGFVCPVSLD